MLTVNQDAPTFSLPNSEEENYSLKDVTTTFALVYFYPKDDTPGCTKEACNLRDVFTEIQELNCTIIGISKDSPASHKKFKDKYDLPFTLLSDESTKTIQAYDAWQEKSMYGKTYMGIQRMSYLIKDGTVVKVYPKVNPKDHADEIIQDLQAMQ